MAKYRIVVEFHDYREFEVEANSPDDARAAYENGEGVFIDVGSFYCDLYDADIVEIRGVDD